jgi:hypothetical protein
VDGTHSRIRRPSSDDSLYFSGYKWAHTIQSQITVDFDGNILAVEVGNPGRDNDKGIFNHSLLNDTLDHNDRLLADGGYPGSASLVIPWTVRQVNGDADRLAFNHEQQQWRVTVEHVIGRIKGYWGSVDRQWRRQLELQPIAFYVACLLTQRLARIRGGFYCNIRDCHK